MSLIETLGNPQRLRIIQQLSDGPMYVTELADTVGMNGKSAVHHLTVLEDEDLVEHFWDGNRKYYRLIRTIELEISPPPERRFILQRGAERAAEPVGGE
ncbi:ArsR/SmtB family transcription factor [Halorubrum lipolyticum]|nr:winged helix-turn-helix domain-containing protein [Halorubrum lipolyticum]